MSRRQFRGGFTLIELLVVIAIIALLIGMLLSAVQKVRDSGAKSVCYNNLHQIGVAIHKFHDDLGMLPTAGVAPWWGPNFEGSDPAPPRRQHAGWGYQILPFMDQAPLYKRTDPWNYNVKNYQCPGRRSDVTCQWTGCFLNDYVGMTPDGDYWGWGEKNGAIVRYGTPIRMAALTDGFTQTVMITEKRLIRSNYNTGDWHDDRGWSDAWDPDIMRASYLPPQQDSNDNWWDTPYQAGSAHMNGVQTLFADSSVRTILYAISQSTWQGMCHRSDNAIIIDP